MIVPAVREDVECHPAECLPDLANIARQRSGSRRPEEPLRIFGSIQGNGDLQQSFKRNLTLLLESTECRETDT